MEKDDGRNDNGEHCKRDTVRTRVVIHPSGLGHLSNWDKRRSPQSSQLTRLIDTVERPTYAIFYRKVIVKALYY